MKRASATTSSGVDHVTWGDVKSNTSLFVSRLHRDLKLDYNLSPLRPIPIPKPNGKGMRVICVPTIRDRIVQRMLVQHLMTRPGAALIRNSVSYAFMSSVDDDKKGIHPAQNKALELRRKFPWAHKSDITSFFDNIPRKQVVDRTMQMFRQPSFRGLLQKTVACEVARVDPGTNRRVDQAGLRPGIGVRQGMPISPFLSNVILQRFDSGMAANGFHAVRYADDFIVFCESRDECLRVDNLARSLLNEQSFTLPALEPGSKTQIAEPEEAIEFLGLEIAKASDALGDYALCITPKQLAHIRDELGYFRDFDRLARDRVTLAAAVQGATNRIAGYRAAYTAASNVSQLIKVLNNEARESTRALFVKAFGEKAVSELSANKAMVLGIKEFPETKVASRRR
nr:reverse transcriptase domain-containing protein [Tianweitania aestuarii]